jgi:hypothetical protein
MPRTVFEFAVGARRHQRDVLADVCHLDATNPLTVNTLYRQTDLAHDLAHE